MVDEPDVTFDEDGQLDIRWGDSGFTLVVREGCLIGINKHAGTWKIELPKGLLSINTSVLD